VRGDWLECGQRAMPAAKPRGGAPSSLAAPTDALPLGGTPPQEPQSPPTHTAGSHAPRAGGPSREARRVHGAAALLDGRDGVRVHDGGVRAQPPEPEPDELHNRVVAEVGGRRVQPRGQLVERDPPASARSAAPIGEARRGRSGRAGAHLKAAISLSGLSLIRSAMGSTLTSQSDVSCRSTRFPSLGPYSRR
jgi:hypothetical protein